MKNDYLNSYLPNTTITIKEFKKLCHEKFDAHPMMFMDYKYKKLIIMNSFYTKLPCLTHIDITQAKLSNFCKKLNIPHTKLIYRLAKSIEIDLALQSNHVIFTK